MIRRSRAIQKTGEKCEKIAVLSSCPKQKRPLLQTFFVFEQKSRFISLMLLRLVAQKRNFFAKTG